MRQVSRTLAEIAHVLAASDGADHRVIAALKLLHRVIAYERCALLEIVQKNGRCELYAVPDLPAEQRTALRNRLIALLRLMADEGNETRAQAYGAGDGAELEDQQTDGANIPTHLAIPVIGLDQLIGVLFVEQSGEEYDEHSLRLLTVAAAQLGSYLTTLRLREDELEHARQLGVALQRLEETDRRKDEFLAMLGHELRNPLGAINNALRILDQGQASSIARYHQVIDRQIAHLSRIVDDLLDASRVRLGKIMLDLRPVDLRTVAERWMEAFGATAQVRAHDLRLEVPDEPVIVAGDPVRLEQILSNLLTNALKYTPPGGRIEIRVERDAGHGIIVVEDSGIGMTPEVLATVFELFTQADDALARSEGGLGLGLPLVRSLVEKHDGTVVASSAGLGKGSEFVVRLPLGRGVEGRPDVPLDRPAAAPLRILVIEDQDDAREMLVELLSRWGHVVDTASDGIQGVARALASTHDALLVDIGLPKLDGYGVARRIRAELGERTPALLAMTGYGQPEDRRRAMDAGFDAHMVKPMDAFVLRERLASIRPL